MTDMNLHRVVLGRRGRDKTTYREVVWEGPEPLKGAKSPAGQHVATVYPMHGFAYALYPLTRNQVAPVPSWALGKTVIDELRELLHR